MSRFSLTVLSIKTLKHANLVKDIGFIDPIYFYFLSKPCLILFQCRFYSFQRKKAKLTEKEIEERVLKVCASYDKVTADKVSML